MLALSYKLYLVKKEPYFSALLFSIPLAIVGLIMGYTLIGVFVGSAILFALAFVFFFTDVQSTNWNAGVQYISGNGNYRCICNITIKQGQITVGHRFAIIANHYFPLSTAL
jgi:hypothetical protein